MAFQSLRLSYSKPSLEDQKLLLFLALLARAVATPTIAGDEGGFVALVSAGSGIGVARLDIDERLRAQFGEISTRRRLQAFGVNGLANTVRDVFQGRNAGRPMGRNLQDNEALFGANYAGVFSLLE